ncbi:ion transporter [Merismopedia glauca]|uniref:Ion transporter n=1 Tax=Merismopedia glauca CCAP 1448/3 TaxID=1296344 RepID=A0A2T1C5I3_9CYAN|nr:ion transporter [Merismopedia glauca]PSB03521.1 Ion transporter [Merismopedia glauca CCAP 1448/3]
MESFRKKVAFYLEDIETPIGRTINLLITSLVLLSSGIFVAETYPIPEYVRLDFEVIDFTILVLFAYEYIIRLWCADRKIKFIFSIYSIIDLLALVPYFLGLVNVSYLRIFRWFRILRLIRFIEGKTFFGLVTKEDTIIFARIIFTLFAIIFVYSGLIYQVEHPVNGKVFKTFLDAVYFSVVTMTTVGFGDVTPISEVGRLLTVLMILTGIALIPTQLANLIKQFIKTTNQVTSICPVCGFSPHDIDAIFCKICGASLDKS